MKVRLIVQSRLSSQRLPAKALLPVAGLPSVVLCAKRAGNRGREVVVATSKEKDDDFIVEELIKHSVPYCRGSCDNVLARFVLASQDLADADVIVRLTADNLLPDGELIEEALDTFFTGEHDFLRTMFPDSPLPYGLSLEIGYVRDLRKANEQATSPIEKEHVTPWIFNQAKHKKLFIPSKLYNEKTSLSYLRCTIDYYQDYLTIKALFHDIQNPIEVSWPILVEKLKEQNKYPMMQNMLTLGTAQLGMGYGINNIKGMPTDKEANAILEQAVQLGIAAIDTARAYGEAEKRIGQFFNQIARSFPIITKLDPRIENEEALAASIYQSCYFLKVDVLDTLLLHRWSTRYANDEKIWQELRHLKRQGLIKELGASVDSITDAIDALSDNDITHLQIPFNIVDWRWQQASFLTSVAKRSDVTIHVRSALLQGLLVSTLGAWPTLNKAMHLRINDTLDAFVKKLNRQNRLDLCYAYCRSFPWISSVVVGVETVEQLIENSHYFKQPLLSTSEINDIHEAFTFVPETLLNPALWNNI